MAIGYVVASSNSLYPPVRVCVDNAFLLVFYINLPFGAVIIPLLLFSNIPDQMVKPKAMEVIRNLPSYIDFPGFFLLSGASISLLLALNWGGEAYKWSSPVIIGTMVAAGVLLVLFLAWCGSSLPGALCEAMSTSLIL